MPTAGIGGAAGVRYSVFVPVQCRFRKQTSGAKRLEKTWWPALAAAGRKWPEMAGNGLTLYHPHASPTLRLPIRYLSLPLW
ncbi:hypothetical protein ACFOET_19005 [Parapedobacter deserti]|uniref:Uncharacterized protein n=1 Tax=Parapedobacter deserti TaxID=1912957 RepID=A0ABV7JNN2_9SPHI